MIDTLTIAGVIEDTIDKKEYIKLVHADKKIHYYKWIGGNTTIIQVGDQIDRCRSLNGNSCITKETTYQDENSDYKIIYFMTGLHYLAIKHGGAVYSLLGNHELMNVYGNLDYVSYLGLKPETELESNTELESETELEPETELESKKVKITIDLNYRTDKFKRGKTISKFLACSRLSVMIINNVLYAHAGFVNTIIDNIKQYYKIKHIKDDKEVDKIDMTYVLSTFNNIIKLWLLDSDLPISDLSKSDNKYILDPEYTFKLISNTGDLYSSPPPSPFWYRDLGYLRQNIDINSKIISPDIYDLQDCSLLKEALKMLNIQGMVIGHTPQYNDKRGINSTCSNSLFRIDVGASKAFRPSMDEFVNKNSDKNNVMSYEIVRKAQVLEIDKGNVTIIKYKYKHENKTDINGNIIYTDSNGYPVTKIDNLVNTREILREPMNPLNSLIQD